MAVVKIKAPASSFGTAMAESGRQEDETAPAESTTPVIGGTTTGTTDNDSSDRADWKYVFLVYVFLIILIWYAPTIATNHGPEIPFTLPEGAEEFGLFAAFYLLAQAIERLIEPLSHLKIGGFKLPKGKNLGFLYFGGAKEVLVAQAARNIAEAEKAKLAGDDKAAQDKANSAANDKSDAKQIEANTAIVMWGIASGIGVLACALLGLQLMHTIGMQAKLWLDIAVSGIAVGSGTKVLHELINRLQNGNNSNNDNEDSD